MQELSPSKNPAVGFDELRVQDLRKLVGAFHLEAELKVGAGERLALTSRSGGGKSTLLRVIAGLQPLEKNLGDRGRVLLGGEEITDWAPERRRIGFVFQEPALFPHLNVIENASFALRMQGVGREEREAVALEWLTRVDLRTRARARVTELSGGERQRVAFVRALLWKPRALLLDEPFSALDADLRGTLRRELVALHALWPVPLVLVSHDEADLTAIATHRCTFQESTDQKVRRFRR